MPRLDRPQDKPDCRPVVKRRPRRRRCRRAADIPDQLIIATAIPKITVEFNSLTELSWLASGFL